MSFVTTLAHWFERKDRRIAACVMLVFVAIWLGHCQDDAQRKEATHEFLSQAMQIAESNKAAIAAHKVRIGMSDEQCREAWGNPDRVNRTITRDRITEQWIYDSKGYLYFEDGVLRAIQN